MDWAKPRFDQVFFEPAGVSVDCVLWLLASVHSFENENFVLFFYIVVYFSLFAL